MTSMRKARRLTAPRARLDPRRAATGARFAAGREAAGWGRREGARLDIAFAADLRLSDRATNFSRSSPALQALDVLPGDLLSWLDIGRGRTREHGCACWSSWCTGSTRMRSAHHRALTYTLAICSIALLAIGGHRARGHGTAVVAAVIVAPHFDAEACACSTRPTTRLHRFPSC